MNLYDVILEFGADFLNFLTALVGIIIAGGGFWAVGKIINAGQRAMARHSEKPDGGELKSFWGIAANYLIIALGVGLLSGFGGALIIKWALVGDAGSFLLDQFLGPIS